jgi:hypothetical protein
MHFLPMRTLSFRLGLGIGKRLEWCFLMEGRPSAEVAVWRHRDNFPRLRRTLVRGLAVF